MMFHYAQNKRRQMDKLKVKKKQNSSLLNVELAYLFLQDSIMYHIKLILLNELLLVCDLVCV